MGMNGERGEIQKARKKQINIFKLQQNRHMSCKSLVAENFGQKCVSGS